MTIKAIEDSSGRLAGYNQIPDFGDAKGTLQESGEENSDDER